MTTVRHLGYEAGSATERGRTFDDGLLTCGIVSSLLYLAMTVFIAGRWPGYSSRAQTISELSAMVTVALMLLAIGFVAAALDTRFRVYSIATMMVLFVFGFLTTRDAPAVGANLPTPWLGVWERISLGAFLLWVIVAAVALRRHASPRAKT